MSTLNCVNPVNPPFVSSSIQNYISLKYLNMTKKEEWIPTQSRVYSLDKPKHSGSVGTTCMILILKTISLKGRAAFISD